MKAHSNKQRIVALQKQLTIARRALSRIGGGWCSDHEAETTANDALEEIRQLDPPTGLQGLVEHGENVR